MDKKIIVTGGFGFIGSNLVLGLNRKGYTNIIVVDDLTDGVKFNNLIGAQFLDYCDKTLFIEQLENKKIKAISAIFHQGACSTTTEWNGKFMMENNYDYSKKLLNYALSNEIPFIYASSAAVYGHNKSFKIIPENERPINIYGYSKYLFDQYVRQRLAYAKNQIVGLRYFNVYGPREQHKGNMASVAYHHYLQIHQREKVKLFSASEGYASGEQRRDFVYVEDIVNINLWFLEHPQYSGIFNAGTGHSESFNKLAQAVIDFYKKGSIEYIDFPETLKGRYQSFTEADISTLREIGYSAPFKTVQAGVTDYLNWLNQNLNAR